MSFLYVNGQDIARLVLGVCEEREGSWVFSGDPEVFSVAPEAYLATIDAYIQKKMTDFSAVTGFVLVAGPGSATALRASHALVNALAYARSLPVYSLSKDPLVLDSSALLQASPENVRVALPVYAHEARITQGTKDALRRK